MLFKGRSSLFYRVTLATRENHISEAENPSRSGLESIVQFLMIPYFPPLLHRFIIVICLATSLICCQSASGAVSDEHFPLYESIEANVAFWKLVYAKYPSTKGIIHDSNDLSLIYEVIDLRPDDEQGSRQANQRKTKAMKAKYRGILKELAKGGPAATKDQKRVVALFGSRGGPEAWDKAADTVRFQLCLSDRFQEGVRRSGRYIVEMKNIFRNAGLPVDLAYLPHVESSFNYKAYSKFGAAGIWQFIRSTGRRFMAVDYTVDERRDPIIATHAAAKYLKENYELLGSWPLALTAYNHGANSMLRAKNKHGDYERIYNQYENRNFGFASRNFYAEFLAAREVAKNYRTYFEGLTLDKKVATFNLKMAGYAPINEIANHFGVGLETLQDYNPALRRPIFTGQKYIPKGYTLKLPENTDTSLAHIPAHLYKEEQKRSRFYRVERGDTAGKIARMHKVTLHDLMDINQLSRRATIYVGQNLRIPAPGEMERTTMTAAAPPPAPPSAAPQESPPAPPKIIAALEQPSGQTPASEPLGQAPPSTPPATTSPASPAPQATAKRESAPAPPIAAVPQAQERDLETPEPPVAAKTARIELAMLESHQQPRLIPPAPALQTSHTEEEILIEGTGDIAVDPPTTAAAAINPEIIIGNFQVERVYTKKGKTIGVVQVESLETLGHYADWLEIPTQHIRLLNGFSFRRQIKAHQKIEIPLDTIGKDLFEERRYEFHKEIEEDFFAAYKVVGVDNYRIKKGDNIWTLSMETLELPFWLIKKYNPTLEAESLMPGQQLVIPIVEKTS